MKVLLASKSPRRRQLISSIIRDVEFTESGADEKLPPVNLKPCDSAMFLAEKKALKSLLDNNNNLDRNELVIGCDTVVSLGNKIFGKPKDGMDAFRTLKELSGRTHEVITAVCIIDKTYKHDLFYDTTDVTFNELDDSEIWDYINSGDPFDKAGSYGIQNVPETFIKEIEGDLDNVIGLPTAKLKEHLKDFNKISDDNGNGHNELLELILFDHLRTIEPVSEKKRREAEEYLKTKTMPTWALGKLLDLGVELAGITGNLKPETKNKTIFVLAGDNGVAEENVSAYPQEVTLQMAENILNGGAGINVLADQVGAEVYFIDMGMKEVLDSMLNSEKENLTIVHVADGTENIKLGPAMSRSQALIAIWHAYKIAQGHITRHNDNVVGIGELGIGNTTPAAAIMSVLGGLPVERITGHGTGISEEELQKKIEVIKEAVRVNNPDPNDPLDVLAKLGSYEIAGMVGVIFAAASKKIPVVLDGYISSAAALIAYHLETNTADYMIASHKSIEPGHQYFYELIDKEPLLNLNMRLGEGTGAAVAMHLIDCASAILRDMATFEEANVSDRK